MVEPLSTWRWTLGGILLTGSLAIGIWGLSSSDVRADREGHEREGEHQEYGFSRASAALDPLYTQECGSCHLVYPANLLPAASWKAVMAGLEDHFGENAELDQQDNLQIESFLINNSADNGRYANLRYAATIDSRTVPLRITELPFFVREHDEVPKRMVQGNEQVGSFSQCDACHTNATRGDFDEDQVSIPGFGRWDD